MRRLSWIVTIPLALLLISFALSNRDRVEIRLWPLNWAVDAPFFLMVLASAFVGFLLGGILVWLQHHGARRAARTRAARIRVLEAEVERLRERLARPEARAIDGATVSLPAVPPPGGSGYARTDR